MYKVKAKPGYSILVGDLSIKLTYNFWQTISEEQYNSSNDLKRMKDYIIIENDNNIIDKVKVLNNNATNVKKDLFVMDPNNDALKLNEIFKDEIVINTNEPVEEVKIENIETSEVKEIEIIPETIKTPEVIEPVVTTEVTEVIENIGSEENVVKSKRKINKN